MKSLVITIVSGVLSAFIITRAGYSMRCTVIRIGSSITGTERVDGMKRMKKIAVRVYVEQIKRPLSNDPREAIYKL
jgi:hypothetical protein